MFQTKVVDEVRTHILCSVFIFSENHAVNEEAEKNVTARQTTVRLKIDAIFVPDN
jgi:hypothetical protein